MHVCSVQVHIAYTNKLAAAAAAAEAGASAMTAAVPQYKWMDTLFEQHFKMLNMVKRQRIIACLFIGQVEWRVV